MIPFHISCNFSCPKLRACCRNLAESAAMAMPEAAVDKNNGMMGRERQVRATGQITTVQTEPQSTCMQTTPQKHFWLCITALDAAHVEPPLFGRQNIRHFICVPWEDGLAVFCRRQAKAALWPQVFCGYG